MMGPELTNGQQFISQDISFLVWIIHHQHWILHRFARRGHRQMFRHIALLRDTLGWILAHWPATGRYQAP